MEKLAELLSDMDSVFRGYIALTGVKIVGHMCIGQDRTLPLSMNHNDKAKPTDEVLWCYVEKERGKAPTIYPVVSESDDLDRPPETFS